jgi:hypothetical protein
VVIPLARFKTAIGCPQKAWKNVTTNLLISNLVANRHPDGNGCSDTISYAGPDTISYAGPDTISYAGPDTMAMLDLIPLDKLQLCWT